MSISVDAGRCVGHARCLFYAPSVFGFDDEGSRAVVLVQTPPEDVQPLVHQAAENCPERAITIDFGAKPDSRTQS